MLVGPFGKRMLGLIKNFSAALTITNRNCSTRRAGRGTSMTLPHVYSVLHTKISSSENHPFLSSIAKRLKHDVTVHKSGPEKLTSSKYSKLGRWCLTRPV